jgi:two-component system cell cycle response regulator CpdR
MAKILIAEDDVSMREFLSMALERAGHSVLACEDGDSALDKLSKDKAFDLLVADVIMPGMDGIELSQKARHLFPDLKVMFITGFAAVAVSEQDKDSENAPVLSKPFHLNKLISEIETLLGSKES